MAYCGVELFEALLEAFEALKSDSLSPTAELVVLANVLIS